MPKQSVAYSNTIIYKIYCKDECITDIYVGHTTNFIQRKSTHKAACNNQKNDLKIYKIIRENGGWNNWNMIEIAKYNCKDSTDARIKENEHYNQLKATLNSCPPYVDKNNYFCSTCNLQCSSPTQYETHLKCVKHNNLKVSKEDNINNHFTSNNINKFVCEICDYRTSKKSSFVNHNNSIKHKNNELATSDNDVMPKLCLSAKYQCKNCDKNFNDRTGLWRHNKKCILNKDDKKEQTIDKDQLIMMLIKENSDFKSMLIEQQSMMMKLIENGTTNNSNNITF